MILYNYVPPMLDKRDEQYKKDINIKKRKTLNIIKCRRIANVWLWEWMHMFWISKNYRALPYQWRELPEIMKNN